MNLIGKSQRLPAIKRVLCVIVFGLATCFWPTSAAAQVALVSVTSCGPESFPAPCTIPSTGSGHLLVIGWTGEAGASVLKTVSDNAGNRYTEAKGTRAANWNGKVSADIWYAANIDEGATWVTLTPTPSGSTGEAVIWEFSGVSTTLPLAQTAALSRQPTTTAPAGASVTTTTAGEVIVSIVAGSKRITGIEQGNPFAEDSSVGSDGWAHLIASSPGAYTAQWSESPSGAYCSSTAAFYATVGGLTYLLTASPTNLTFGEELIGSCSTLPVILTNTGTGSVSITQDTVTGTSLTPSGLSLPYTLTAGQNIDLSINFCPTTGARVTGSAMVMSTASDSPATVSLSGTGQHNVVLSWSPSSSSGVTGYDVYRSTASGGPYTQISSVANTNYTDSSVAAGQKYYYQVTAVSSAGHSAAASLPGPVAIPSP